jgi:glycosyltransferase involved in cell wall biosynthesis
MRDLVVICQVFYPELISTGQTLTELCEALAEMGVRLTVIAAQPTLMPGCEKVPCRIAYREMEIRRTWSTRLPKTHALGKAINLITFFASATWEVLARQKGRDLLLLTNPPYLPLLGWLAHILRKQRFGVLLFDIMPEQAELIGFIRPNGFLARVWRRLNRLWYRRANYVVVLSQDMIAGALKNAGLLGTREELEARRKTRIIHVWSDDRNVRPMPKSESLEANHLGCQNLFVVQYSGNHSRFHDIETVLDLAATYRPSDGIHFQFIGEGQKKKLVDQRRVAESMTHVYSASYVSKDRLSHSLAMADIGIVAQLPGQERVCYPSKLLGIFAAGRPVLAICPLECAMARMIREHQVGFVIANGDIAAGRKALEEARADSANLTLMGERAAALLNARFRLSQAARSYFELISPQEGLCSDSEALRHQYEPIESGRLADS